jgi:hypothetical protein
MAAAVDAVPALWSGPCPHGGPAIAPIRPPLGRPPKWVAAAAPPAARAAVAHAARAGTASGLNDVLLAAAAFAALGAIAGFAFGPDPATQPPPSTSPSDRPGPKQRRHDMPAACKYSTSITMRPGWIPGGVGDCQRERSRYPATSSGSPAAPGHGDLRPGCHRRLRPELARHLPAASRPAGRQSRATGGGHRTSRQHRRPPPRRQADHRLGRGDRRPRRPPRRHPAATSFGYHHEGDLRVPGREAFTTPAGAPPHHLYVCAVGTPALNRHLAFPRRPPRRPESGRHLPRPQAHPGRPPGPRSQRLHRGQEPLRGPGRRRSIGPLGWAALGPRPGRQRPERLRTITGSSGNHLSSSAPLSGRAPQATATSRFAAARWKPGFRSLISTHLLAQASSVVSTYRWPTNARTLRLVASPREVPMGAVLFWLGVGW